MAEESIRVGTIERTDGGYKGRLERTIGHGVDAVWHKLTDQHSLHEWLAPGSIELRKGGPVHIDFIDSGITIDSSVLAVDAPRLLEYSWSSGHEPQRPLR